MTATNDHYQSNKILFFTWDAIFDADGVVQKWHRPHKHDLEAYCDVVAQIPAEQSPYPPEPKIFETLRGQPRPVSEHLGSFSIFEDPSDPNPDRRFKMIGRHPTGVNGFPKLDEIWATCFYTFTSPDGENWSEPKVIDHMGDTGDTGAVFYDRKCKLYRFFTRKRGYFFPNDNIGDGVPDFVKQPRKKGHPNGRWIAMTTSPDWENWSELSMVINKDPKDDEGIEFYCLQPFLYGDIYLGYLRIYNGWEGTMATELVWSEDCLRWHRAPQRMLFTEPGDLGDFDFCFGNLANELPYRYGDTLYMKYEGREHIHAPYQVKSGEGHKVLDMGLSVCTMRVDGFVSIDTGRMGGNLLTEALPIAGKKLIMNARTVKDGYIKMELLDSNNNVISQRPTVFESDDIAYTIGFDGNTTLPATANGRARLRISMKNAAIYSFCIE